MATVTKASVPSGAALRERTVAALRAMEGDLRRRGVLGLGLYGSLARAEATPSSDVDLLLTVERGAPFTLLDMSEVRLLVADRLGRDAGVVVDEDVSPEFRQRIADDLVTIY
ncbi:MAG: nucleotidyltransferase domain-containing protein [Geminicoccaceae bacterium]